MFLYVVVVTVLALITLGGLGFRADARRFPPLKAVSRVVNHVPLPGALPESVQQHGKAIFGGSDVPCIHSAVAQGRAVLRFGRVRVPARFRFYYDGAGAYYHLIQVTWFGMPIMTINERFLGGHAILDLPVGRIENDWHTDHAANQGFWAEAFVWVPSLLYTDSRIRWEAVDEATVRVFLPNADDDEAFTVRFDPSTGLMKELSTQRYRDANVDTKLKWTNHILEWSELDGVKVPIRSETQWNNDPPWATWHVEQIVYNVDVAGRMKQFGGTYQG